MRVVTVTRAGNALVAAGWVGRLAFGYPHPSVLALPAPARLVVGLTLGLAELATLNVALNALTYVVTYVVTLARGARP